ncbi:hypothetical protein D0Z07_4060 [Hyphodiscus hymeniophilus]|uniref:HD domain-containing protein n=1 Tax=Hyphodiscus hymeniophilus TaxID=353542 RepID=A0A9P6VK47_9HELO|nr:hypothetical protein D0Z07_4060 [Hyphodiscus hymeniophilus]
MAKVPTKVIAGVTVPDTPLIDKAYKFARENLEDYAFNHVVRSWLFGSFIGDQIPGLQGRDVEVHAIAALLHDMGWSKNPKLISKDKRFEVDGANVAREFLIREGNSAEWDTHRLQLAWDAIALHGTFSIAQHKEIEVQSCMMGVVSDFTGPEKSPGGVLTREVWDQVVKEYSRTGFKDGVIEEMCGLCRTKPETTYENFVSSFGTEYVNGYSAKGHRLLDVTLAIQE